MLGVHFFPLEHCLHVLLYFHNLISLCFHPYRVYYMVKDFCGSVTEESVRANILLVFEVLCEVMVRFKQAQRSPWYNTTLLSDYLCF